MRFDASRQQLVIVGEYDNSSDSELPAPWARALELSDGAVAWELLGSAPQLTADGTFGGPEGSGPPLYDMAIDPHGNMLFSGSVGRGLEYVWVGSAACAD